MAASQLPSIYDVVIVGAGVSGIAAAHYLLKANPALSLLILEKGPGVGGTWLWNVYPGGEFLVLGHAITPPSP